MSLMYRAPAAVRALKVGVGDEHSLGPSAKPADPPSSRPPPLRVEAAVKLVSTGKFSENDVETFLISFEKAAKLNNFPPDSIQLSCRPILAGKLWKFY